MSRIIPPVLASLLAPGDPKSRERAWEAFVARHSGLILHTIRRSGGGHDVVMDRYAFVLEQLNTDDCRRLRMWAGDGRSEFTTWLVVVVKRLCQDHHRRRYGRLRSAGSEAAAERKRRRELVDFVMEELRPELLPAGPGGDSCWHDPEHSLRESELHDALAHALGELDSSDRMILALRFQQDLSAAGIARAMSLPSPFHVYRRLKHAFGELRRSLIARGIEDPVP